MNDVGGHSHGRMPSKQKTRIRGIDQTDNPNRRQNHEQHRSHNIDTSTCSFTSNIGLSHGDAKDNRHAPKERMVCKRRIKIEMQCLQPGARHAAPGAWNARDRPKHASDIEQVERKPGAKQNPQTRKDTAEETCRALLLFWLFIRVDHAMRALHTARYRQMPEHWSS